MQKNTIYQKHFSPVAVHSKNLTLAIIIFFFFIIIIIRALTANPTKCQNCQKKKKGKVKQK